MFDAKWFFDLDSRLRKMGVDSDEMSFDDILENIKHPKKVSPETFAASAAYVILASGFNQKTAKEKHKKIIQEIQTNGANFDALLEIFGNDKKIKAICNIWNNRKKYCDSYYACKTLDEKSKFLITLPYIGSTTVNHLLRNLGENTVKYDRWILRLGALYGGNRGVGDVKTYCDDMFDCLERETNLPRGYIDVVLFRACQNKLIDLDNQ